MGKMEIKELSSKVLDAYHSKSELLKTFENLSDTILDHIGGLPQNQDHWKQFQEYHITGKTLAQLKEQSVFFYRDLLSIWQQAEDAKAALLADTQITREEVKSYGTAVQDVIDAAQHYLTRYQSSTTVLNVKDVGIKVCGNPNENSLKEAFKGIFAYGCRMSDILFNKVIPAIKEIEFVRQIPPAEVKPADPYSKPGRKLDPRVQSKLNAIYGHLQQNPDVVRKKPYIISYLAKKFNYLDLETKGLDSRQQSAAEKKNSDALNKKIRRELKTKKPHPLATLLKNYVVIREKFY